MVFACRWLVIAAVLALVAACGSDDSNGNSGAQTMAGNGGGAGTGSGPGAVGTELDDAILFSPMYTAFDGERPFRVPAIVNGYTGVTWDAEDRSMVELVQTGENSVLITALKPGTTRIIARSGPLSGSAEIHITESTPELWMIGEQRYNNEVPLPMLDRSMLQGIVEMIPDDLSCKGCHGTGAMALSVEHTPQQTGGYSDEELIAIFTMGQKPEGVPHRSGIPAFAYRMFHTWEATEEEKLGLVTYLRSFEPASQGDIDFGGIFD